MELRDLINNTPYYYSKAFKYLVEIVGNKKFIRFAFLGLPQSGKTHFICIVRNEPYDPSTQTNFDGDPVGRKEIEINGKTLVFERTRDINGLNLSQYPDLIARADIIYFFFRADYYLKNTSLNDIMEDFTPADIEQYKTYREIVYGYFGSVIRDKNARNKPIKVILSFKKNVLALKDSKDRAMVKSEFESKFTDADLSNCGWFIADIDDEHRDWVKNNAKQLIFNNK